MPGEQNSVYQDEESVRETLAIEDRLLANGFGNLPDLLGSGGDFHFESATVAGLVAEASQYLRHQQSIELAGARILATVGEVAVKAQAYDAIAALIATSRSGASNGDPESSAERSRMSDDA